METATDPPDLDQAPSGLFAGWRYSLSSLVILAPVVGAGEPPEDPAGVTPLSPEDLPVRALLERPARPAY